MQGYQIFDPRTGVFLCNNRHCVHMHCLYSQESSDFSNFQVKRLMQKSKLSRKIDHVVKELNAEGSGDMAAQLTEGQGRSFFKITGNP